MSQKSEEKFLLVFVVRGRGELGFVYWHKKPSENGCFQTDCGGAGGIRTHVPLRTTWFRVKLVTTTSIPLHSKIFNFSCEENNFEYRIQFWWETLCVTRKSSLSREKRSKDQTPRASIQTLLYINPTMLSSAKYKAGTDWDLLIKMKSEQKVEAFSSDFQRMLEPVLKPRTCAQNADVVN